MNNKEKQPYTHLLQLPSEVESIFSSSKVLSQTFWEFMDIDPGDAMHCMMEVEVFVYLLDNLGVKHIASLPDRMKIREVGSLGLLLHDIGKVGVTPDVGRSLAITQNVPSSFGSHLPVGMSSNGHLDSRSLSQKAMHKLHPLVGKYMALELAERETDDRASKLIRQAANIIGSHHEMHGKKQLYDFAERPIQSYPNDQMLYGTGSWGYQMMIMKLSDVAVAMGRKRPFRDWEYSDTNIMHELENVMNDEALDMVFGENIEPYSLRGEYIKAVFEGLEEVTRKYSDDVCMGVMTPKISGLEKNGYSNSGLLADVVMSAWKKMGKKKAEKQIEKLLG